MADTSSPTPVNPNKYQHFLSELETATNSPTQLDLLLQAPDLTTDLEHYNNLIKPNLNSVHDIFTALIHQIVNPQFRTLLLTLNQDKHFLASYMSLTENNYSEYVSIAYGDDGVGSERFRSILVLIILSSSVNRNFFIETSKEDLKLWLQAHAQIEEFQLQIASTLSANIEDQPSGIFRESDSVNQIKIDIQDPNRKYTRFIKSSLDKDALLNLVRYYNWIEDLRDYLNSSYRDFDLFKDSKLLIVLGSVGEPGFNKAKALVAENLTVYANQDPEYSNKEVKYCLETERLVKLLNVVCGRSSSFSSATENQIDWYCTNSSDCLSIFHLNVCLSIWSAKTRASVLSTALLNLIILESKSKATTLIILDTRLPEHTHISNANRSLVQDRVAIDAYRSSSESDSKNRKTLLNGKTYEGMIRSNDLFRLKGIDLFESCRATKPGGFLRIGSLGYKYFNDFDYQFLIFALGALHDRGEGFPLDLLYL